MTRSTVRVPNGYPHGQGDGRLSRSPQQRDTRRPTDRPTDDQPLVKSNLLPDGGVRGDAAASRPKCHRFRDDRNKVINWRPLVYTPPRPLPRPVNNLPPGVWTTTEVFSAAAAGELFGFPRLKRMLHVNGFFHRVAAIHFMHSAALRTHSKHSVVNGRSQLASPSRTIGDEPQS